MKSKNKKITIAVSLALGVTIFAGAAFASYNTSSGYQVGKNAIKGLMSNENYTANLEIKMSVDGSELGKTTIQELYDRNGDVRLNRSEKSESSSSYIGNSEFKAYGQDGSYITMYDNSDDEAEPQINIYGNEAYMGTGMFDEMNNMNDDDTDTFNKVIRFVELAADTFVGDLKNNFVYVSGDDDSETYEIRLDAVQIPEVVNAGLSAMFSSMSKYDNEDPYMVLGTDPVVKSAYMKFTVDSEGRFTDCTVNGTMSGNDHEAAIDISLEMSGYGTTQPERVDISTFSNIHTHMI